MSTRSRELPDRAGSDTSTQATPTSCLEPGAVIAAGLGSLYIAGHVIVAGVLALAGVTA